VLAKVEAKVTAKVVSSQLLAPSCQLTICTNHNLKGGMSWVA